MRVVLIVPAFPQLSETFVVTKALGLIQRGIDIQVVCAESGDEQWAAFGPDHPVHRLRCRVHLTPSAHPAWNVPPRLVGNVVDLGRTAPSELRRALRVGGPSTVARHLFLDGPLIRLAPDVVHFEFGALAVGREDLGRQLGCALTVSFRGSDMAYVGLDTPGFYDRLWASADRVHLLGQALWAQARQRGAPAELHHAIIPPAVDSERLSATEPRPGVLGSSGRPLRVLSVGRLHWTKGYDDALEAIAALRRRGVEVEYRIAGGGELLNAVSFWRHQLGLDDAVELLGPVAPSGVSEQYRWADVVLHSAISEGFCNVVMEAQGHRLPVVCTDAGGLPENVEHEVTGLVVHRRDPGAMSEGLARLAGDGDLRARMGAAGRERVERRFRLSDQLDAWERFYEAAVATSALTRDP
jgi:colanic acid/amylovoran biosynthesis glycosyltransferase